jgi:hypothetical protein
MKSEKCQRRNKKSYYHYDVAEKQVLVELAMKSEKCQRRNKKNDSGGTDCELVMLVLYVHPLTKFFKPLVIEQLNQDLFTKSHTMRAFNKRQISGNTEDIPNQESASPGSNKSGESRADGDLQKRRANKECETDYKTLAKSETKAVGVLRVLVLVLLFVTATITSVGVYLYTSNDETQKFESGYQANAQRIIESFHDAVERRLGAINSMATAITSHSLDTKQTFPFVTIPDFEVRGSDLRVQADAASISWMPLVTDETRVAWEEYALTNRFQIEETFLQDSKRRKKQDDEFGLTNTSSTGTRMLQQSELGNIMYDGTGYHPSIYSNGDIGPVGDDPEGSGPYLPLWQVR